MNALAIALLVAVGAYVVYLAMSGGVMSETAVDSLAKAIAVAEGFYVSGSRPARDHNPGDMTQDLIGKSTGRDGPFVVFATDDDGWENLKAQIRLWLNGDSAHANSSSTIADLSTFYTANDQDTWATNVANALGVSPDTQIGSIS